MGVAPGADSPRRAARVRRLFLAAVERRGAERARLLDGSCAGDPGLRDEVESLLAAHEREGRFDRLVEELTPAPLEPGARVDRYRVRELLGRGGMGEVYRAERTDGHFEQQVALKLLRADLVGHRLARRFLVERQILASLDHPRIARLLDGGVAETGRGPARPFLVMELIEGEPIDELCDRRRLTVERRLALVIEVCAAVHHAHRNLIVHCDLKPSNILVTAAGEPRLLDFGIAKLLDDAALPLPGSPATTGLRLLTPEYASPEQVRGEPVSTATDVYQLGVLLHRLLVGTSPLPLAGSAEPELARLICEQAPLRLSRALPDGAQGERVAAARSTSVRALRRRLAGDLEIVVAKAMHKEPARRYGSAAELGEDLERFLASRPIRARPDTLRYRARRFARRHRVGVALVGVLLVTLIGFTATSLWQASRTAHERERSEEVTAFLVDLIGGLEPGEAPGALVLTESLLERARLQLKGGDAVADGGAGTPPADPLVRARLLGVLGKVYTLRGRFEQGERLLGRALELSVEHLGERHLETARARLALAEPLNYAREYGRSAELVSAALAVLRPRFGPGHPEVVAAEVMLAELLAGGGQRARAAAVLEGILSVGPDRLDSCDRATVLKDLGWIRIEERRFDDAGRLLDEALALRRQEEGEVHPTVANIHDAIGNLRMEEGELELAERRFRTALDIRRRVFEPDHPDVAAGLEHLGVIRRLRGDAAAAEELLGRAHGIYREALGADNPNTARVLGELGLAVAELGDCVRAAPMLRRSLEEHHRRGLAPPRGMGERLELCRDAAVGGP